ncbi:MAG: hypothetical protein CM15mP6_3000 [Methanobacteriota archaeon]|nr:MAG: hypothetical protein CM15mP6_3000 [Euryarchaeota archaeon]
MARGPCLQPITVSIYDEESGEWIEMGGAMPEADYPDCFWSDEEVLWWCGEDTDGDGTLDYTDTWWYYCELSDYGWLCTDSFGQSEDHEFTENNTLLQPFFLGRELRCAGQPFGTERNHSLRSPSRTPQPRAWSSTQRRRTTPYPLSCQYR